MFRFDPQTYGPVFAPLLAIDRRRPLDAGTPDAGARAVLDGLSIEGAFGHTRIVDRDMAACCVSGVWLLYDFLDESHTISQGIETPSGSFWHAIMHRREGDFSNAKYWLRRVGRHAVFDTIGQRAVELSCGRGAEQAVKNLLSGGSWDSCAFADFCEAALRSQSRDRDFCLDIQQAEWEYLFDHCYRAAVDK